MSHLLHSTQLREMSWRAVILFNKNKYVKELKRNKGHVSIQTLNVNNNPMMDIVCPRLNPPLHTIIKQFQGHFRSHIFEILCVKPFSLPRKKYPCGWNVELLHRRPWTGLKDTKALKKVMDSWRPPNTKLHRLCRCGNVNETYRWEAEFIVKCRHGTKLRKRSAIVRTTRESRSPIIYLINCSILNLIALPAALLLINIMT